MRINVKKIVLSLCFYTFAACGAYRDVSASQADSPSRFFHDEVRVFNSTSPGFIGYFCEHRRPNAFCFGGNGINSVHRDVDFDSISETKKVPLPYGQSCEVHLGKVKCSVNAFNKLDHLDGVRTLASLFQTDMLCGLKSDGVSCAWRSSNPNALVQIPSKYPVGVVGINDGLMVGDEEGVTYYRWEDKGKGKLAVKRKVYSEPVTSLANASTGVCFTNLADQVLCYHPFSANQSLQTFQHIAEPRSNIDNVFYFGHFGFKTEQKLLQGIYDEFAEELKDGFGVGKVVKPFVNIAVFPYLLASSNHPVSHFHERTESLRTMRYRLLLEDKPHSLMEFGRQYHLWGWRILNHFFVSSKPLLNVSLHGKIQKLSEKILSWKLNVPSEAELESYLKGAKTDLDELIEAFEKNQYLRPRVGAMRNLLSYLLGEGPVELSEVPPSSEVLDFLNQGSQLELDCREGDMIAGPMFFTKSNGDKFGVFTSDYEGVLFKMGPAPATLGNTPEKMSWAGALPNAGYFRVDVPKKDLESSKEVKGLLNYGWGSMGGGGGRKCQLH